MPFYFDNQHDNQRYQFPSRRLAPVVWASPSRHSNLGIRRSTRDEHSSWSVPEHQHDETYWTASARRRGPEHPTSYSLSANSPYSRHRYCCYGGTQVCRHCDSGGHFLPPSSLDTRIRGNGCIQHPHHLHTRRPRRHEDPHRNTNYRFSDFSDDEDDEDAHTNEATSDEIPDSDAMNPNATATTNANRNAFHNPPSQNVLAQIRRRYDNRLSFVDRILLGDFADDVLDSGRLAQHRRRGRQMCQRLSGGNSRARDQSSQSRRRLFWQ
ncbi:hypothetical protein EMCG_01522 [[Emmonsia] crescens]|uniref:Uncharacterized protein n=1 Tax=[Emmonsia] crescens TaxID=73230 RepID=A0A0G2J2K0_9EURO|nr:hypothetical protein EMCG_01522 [Emmonsia crescens UAMH 3008]